MSKPILKLKSGDVVEWTAQTMGYLKTKRGVVVGFVPAYVDAFVVLKEAGKVPPEFSALTIEIDDPDAVLLMEDEWCAEHIRGNRVSTIDRYIVETQEGVREKRTVFLTPRASTRFRIINREA